MASRHLWIMTPDQWLSFNASAHEPYSLVCRLPERLEPGDTTDDGDILLGDGAYLREGRVWLTEKQALSARYYGWRRTQLAMRRFLTAAGMEYLFQVERGDHLCPVVIRSEP